MYKKGSVTLYVILLGLTVLLAVQLDTFNNLGLTQNDELVEDVVTEIEETQTSSDVNDTSDEPLEEEAQEEFDETQPVEEEATQNIAADVSTNNVSTDEVEAEFAEVVSVEPSAITPDPLVIPEKYVSHEKNALEASQIVYYTNIQRINFGLSEFSTNSVLMQAATAKINDMFDKQYFEHVAPDGKDVMYWADEVGYAYILVGENLALGNFKDEEAMVTAWMESPGHRANILKSSYTEIGVAVGKGEYEGSEVWMGVQIFGTPLSACPSIDGDLYTKIAAKQAIIDSLELQIAVKYPQVSDLPQPTSQEEYDFYLSLVDEYNALVEQHKQEVELIGEMIDIYNAQVQAYNACIATK